MEILQSITQNPTFANVVRSLTVRWYDLVDDQGRSEANGRFEFLLRFLGWSNHGCDYNNDFPTGTLCKALKQLLLLETFVWYGMRYDAAQAQGPSQEVMRSLNPQLRTFRAT